MSLINLGKIKFTWVGEWQPSTPYAKDDVVRYGSASFICVESHTSDTTWAANAAKFEIMVLGLSYDLANYDAGTTYLANTIVKYNESFYISKVDTTGVLPTDTNNWAFFTGSMAQEQIYAINNSLIPAVDGAIDLGSATNRFGSLYVSGQTIYLGDAILEANATSLIITTPDGGVVSFDAAGVSGGDVVLSGNRVQTTQSNSNLELDAAGTGTIELLKDTNVTGNLHATGNITADGNITLGNAPTDTITVGADFTSNLIPDASSTYDLGSTGQRWNAIYGASVDVTGAAAIGGSATVTGDVAVNGGDITTTATTFNLANTTATTVNFAGAATDVQIGAATGTTNVNNNLQVDLSATVTGDVAVNGGDITTTATTFNLVDTNATTVNFAGAATDVQIGAATGITTVNNNLNVGGYISGPATFTIDPAGVGDNTGTVVIAGNLQVDGTTTTINSTVMSVDDKNIILADTASPTDLLADGGGITLKGTTDKTINWSNANAAWTLSENLDILTGKTYRIAGTTVLTPTAVLGNTTTANLATSGTVVSIGANTGTTTVNNELNTGTIRLDTIQSNGTLAIVPTITANAMTVNGIATFTTQLNADGEFATLGDVFFDGPGIIDSDNPFKSMFESVSEIEFGITAGKITIGDTFGLSNINGVTINSGNVSISGFDLTTPEGFTTYGAVTPTSESTVDGLAFSVDILIGQATGTYVLGPLGAGEGYLPGDTFTYVGTDFGGASPANDLVITVVAVDGVGAPTEVTFTGNGVAQPTIDNRTVNVFNDTVTSLYLGGKANNIVIGAVDSQGQPNGDTLIRNNLIVNGDLAVNNLSNGTPADITTNAFSANIFTTNVSTMNIGSAAVELDFGSATGFSTFNHELRAPAGIVGNLLGDVTTTQFLEPMVDSVTGDMKANDIVIVGNADVGLDLSVDGGNITSAATVFNLLNTNVATLNIAGAATAINMGAVGGLINLPAETVNMSGSIVMAGSSITTSNTTFDLLPNTATVVNFATAAIDLQIGSGAGTTTINNPLLQVDGDINVTGGVLSSDQVVFSLLDTPPTITFGLAATDIQIGDVNNTGTTTINNSLVVGADLQVQGGDITTDQASFNIVTTNAGTVNLALSASTVGIGSSAGTTTVNNNLNVGLDLVVTGGDITTTQSTFNLLNTTPSTINFGDAASALNIGATTGQTNVKNNLLVDGTVTVGSTTLDTNQNTFDLLNVNPLTINFGGAATEVNIGAAGGGTTNVKHDLVVDGTFTVKSGLQFQSGDLTTDQATFNLVNTTATTVNFAGDADVISIGALTGTTTVNNNLTAIGDLTVQGGDIITTQTTFNLANATAQTINFGGDATDIQIGSNSGATTFNNTIEATQGINVTGNIIPTADITYDLGSPTNRFGSLYLAPATIYLGTSTISVDETGQFVFQGGTQVGDGLGTDKATFDLLNTIATTINFGGEATTVNIGDLNGIGTTIVHNNLQASADVQIGNDSSTPATISSPAPTVNLFNTGVSLVNFARDAGDIQMGSLSSVVTVANDLQIGNDASVGGDLTVTGNLTLTSLNTTGLNNDFNISPAGTGSVTIAPAGTLTISAGITGTINNVDIGGVTRGTGAFTTLEANSQVRFDGGIASDDSNTGTLVVEGGMGITENLNVGGNISANALTLRGQVLFTNELAVTSGGTGNNSFVPRGVLYGNGVDAVQSTAQSKPGITNQQTSFAILTTTSAGVPTWTDVIDGGTY